MIRAKIYPNPLYNEGLGTSTNMSDHSRNAEPLQWWLDACVLCFTTQTKMLYVSSEAVVCLSTSATRPVFRHPKQHLHPTLTVSQHQWCQWWWPKFWMTVNMKGDEVQSDLLEQLHPEGRETWLEDEESFTRARRFWLKIWMEEDPRRCVVAPGMMTDQLDHYCRWSINKSSRRV
jgi:hypothetical protein